MQLLELSLDTPAENLALDEALLDEAQELGADCEVLRLWESPQMIAVLGRTSRADVELNRAECKRRGVAVGRRVSGGAAVLAGPGCLMYGVVLSHERRPELAKVDRAHRFVLGRLIEALAPLAPGVVVAGTCDLALAERKFSGNALRCKRTHLLYHGTLLYGFPLSEIAACLGVPPRQPDYRQARPHDEFVTNLPASSEAMRVALAQSFEATTVRTQWPCERVAELAASRYQNDAWTYER